MRKKQPGFATGTVNNLSPATVSRYARSPLAGTTGVLGGSGILDLPEEQELDVQPINPVKQFKSFVIPQVFPSRRMAAKK